MRIRRIEVRNFRKLVEHTVIAPVADGMTIISGDNEDGKSTLLQAVRTVLFDRHTLTGNDADAMQPFGHKGRPEIGLDFEIDGAMYRLRKGFCQKPSAELEIPGGRLTGMAVEDKLQELLRFRAPGRGASRADEHHGICGLFWVEQGRAFAPISVSADNRSVLTGALEGEVGQVLGGARGRALKDAVARHYAEFFTRTGRETGALAEISRNLDELTSRVASQREQLRQYDARVEELAKIRDRLSNYRKLGTLAKAQTDFAEAEAQMKELEALRRGVTDARNAKALADAGLQGPAAALRQRGEAVARAARCTDDLSSADAAAKLAQAEVESCTDALKEASAGLQGSETRLADSERILRSIEREYQRKALAEETSRLSRLLTDARAAEERSIVARGKAALTKVDANGLKKLRSLEERRVQAIAALAGSSTLIRFDLEREGSVEVGGSAAPRSGEISIAEPITIRIADVGSLSVIPGGSELPARREAAEKAARDLREALRKVDVASFAEAETSWEECQRHRQESKNQADIVAALAPEGIETLASRVAEAQAMLARFQQEPESTPGSDLDEARTAHNMASEEAVRLHRRRELAQEALGKAREQAARAAALLQSAGSAAAEAVAELKSARDEISDEELRKAQSEAGNRAALALAALEAAESALCAAGPELRELRLEQTCDALANIRKDIDELERSAERVGIELHAAGQRGLGEELEELEGQRTLADAKHRSLARQAASIKLLHEAICRAEKIAREAFLAPVQSRVKPYLGFLIPDAELVLSENDLAVAYLRRGGQDEPYESLSVGAREQLAVLTRLAFADLLRERSIVAPVILDDALVNSDPSRFESMLLALRRAARELQIIVLTCHEAAWMQSGAPVIRLAACVERHS
ncbi:MAG TPA: AAA family ATPase [Rhizomicrobium sp.]|nr:AAA family ATPase [Rhizomicrobium sp.]